MIISRVQLIDAGLKLHLARLELSINSPLASRWWKTCNVRHLNENYIESTIIFAIKVDYISFSPVLAFLFSTQLLEKKEEQLLLCNGI